MLTYDDQENIFKLIANTITEDVTFYAFGGNAMMYYGYKDQTKDIDITFENIKQRKIFIDALTKLGFKETSALRIYIPEKLKDHGKPVVYQRSMDDGRFDLFVGNIFKTILSQKMKEDLFATYEYKGTKLIAVKVLRKEFLVLLKAVTERENDFKDICSILQKEKNFNWQYLIDEAIWQYHHGDSWVLLDLEKTIKELQKYVFIEEKYLQQIYEAHK